jgi:hypothetical protein
MVDNVSLLSAFYLWARRRSLLLLILNCLSRSLFRHKMTFVWEVEGVHGGGLSGTNLLTMRRNILPISSGAAEGKEKQKSPRKDPVQFYQTTRRHSTECVNNQDILIY